MRTRSQHVKLKFEMEGQNIRILFQ